MGAVGSWLLSMALLRLPPVVAGARRMAPAVVVAIGSAAAAALTVGASPTGRRPADVALVSVLAGLVPVAAARARRGPLLVASAIAGVGAPGSALAVGLAFAAIGAALALVVAGTRNGLVRSLAGAALVHSLLRLSWPEAHGATALVAGMAVLVVLRSSFRRLHRRRRRTVALGVGAGSFLLLVVLAAAGLSLLTVRSTLDAAVSSAEQGLVAARAGDVRAAEVELAAAHADLDRVSARLGSVVVAPARWVPIAAQQLAAVDQTVGAARELVGVGADAAGQADLEQIQPREGRIDLARLRAVEGTLAAVVTALDGVLRDIPSFRSPWLVAPLDDGIGDLEARTLDAHDEASGALQAVRAVPSLLGEGGERRWFLAMVTPSEPRGAGGFMGNWGAVTTRDGAIELTELGRSADLNRRGPFEIAVEPAFDERWVDLFGYRVWPGNMTASPDFPKDAVAFSQMAAQAGLGEVEGVVAVDPIALAALLELTGPVEVEGWPVPIGADNAEPVLLHEQYLDAADSSARIEFLEQTTRAVFDRLTAGDLPAVGRIVEVLSPVVRGRHIQVASLRAGDQGFLRDVGIDGALEPAPGDALGVVMQDAVGSKLGWFLRREISYEVEVDDDGTATGSVEVRLRNDIPAGGLEGGYFNPGFLEGYPEGTNRLFLSLYAAQRFGAVTVDGEPLGGGLDAEAGRAVYDAIVEIRPQEEIAVRYELAGRIPLVGGRYRLDVHRQPVVNPDRLTVTVNGETLFDGPQLEDLVLEAEL